MSSRAGVEKRHPINVHSPNRTTYVADTSEGGHSQARLRTQYFTSDSNNIDGCGMFAAGVPCAHPTFGGDKNSFLVDFICTLAEF